MSKRPAALSANESWRRTKKRSGTISSNAATTNIGVSVRQDTQYRNIYTSRMTVAAIKQPRDMENKMADPITPTAASEAIFVITRRLDRNAPIARENATSRLAAK